MLLAPSAIPTGIALMQPVCRNSLLWEGVEGWLEHRKLYTTRNHVSFALTQEPPQGCLGTHVLLSKVPTQGVTAINIT